MKRSVDLGFAERFDHGIFIFPSAVPPAAVILDDSFNPTAQLGMLVGVSECLAALIARELNASQQLQGICAVHCLSQRVRYLGGCKEDKTYIQRPRHN